MRRFTVRFMPQAIEDLQGIADYIAADSVERALTFVDELQRRTDDTLSVLPLGGRIYKDETRFLPLGRYVVLYEVHEPQGVVDVLHITGAMTDWKR